MILTILEPPVSNIVDNKVACAGPCCSEKCLDLEHLGDLVGIAVEEVQDLCWLQRESVGRQQVVANSSCSRGEHRIRPTRLLWILAGTKQYHERRLRGRWFK